MDAASLLCHVQHDAACLSLAQLSAEQANTAAQRRHTAFCAAPLASSLGPGSTQPRTHPKLMVCHDFKGGYTDNDR